MFTAVQPESSRQFHTRPGKRALESGAVGEKRVPLPPNPHAQLGLMPQPPLSRPPTLASTSFSCSMHSPSLAMPAPLDLESQACAMDTAPTTHTLPVLSLIRTGTVEPSTSYPPSCTTIAHEQYTSVSTHAHVPDVVEATLHMPNSHVLHLALPAAAQCVETPVSFTPPLPVQPLELGESIMLSMSSTPVPPLEFEMPVPGEEHLHQIPMGAPNSQFQLGHGDTFEHGCLDGGDGMMDGADEPSSPGGVDGNTKFTGVRQNKGGRFSARIKIGGSNKYARSRSVPVITCSNLN